MRRFNAIQNAGGWAVIYKQAAGRLGQAETDVLFDRALALSKENETLCRGCRGIARMHRQAAVAVGALYLPLREKFGPETAARMLEEAQKPTAIAKHDRIEKFPPRLFMKIVYVITSIMFGERAGFQRKWHCNTARERRFDLLTCPYTEVLQAMGCPEVCPVICIQDDYSFSGMKNGVLFERTKTIGRGDDCCDFCYRLPAEQPQP